MTGEAIRILLDLVILLVAARLGGLAAERLRQPAVLGELLAGVLVGPTLLGQWGVVSGLESDAGATLLFLALLGSILLLFEVGLESDLRLLRKVGGSSMLVALIGIVVSFMLGYAASFALANAWPAWAAADARLPASLLHIFVGATFTATSVGITARVLSEMGKLRTSEARIVLGAAVLDDVGGLLVLAAVNAMVVAALAGTALGVEEILRLAAMALLFLAAAVLLGFRAAPRLLDMAAERMKAPGSLAIVGIAFALAMAYVGERAGLAAIVGAFLAGLLLSPARHAPRLFAEVRPIGALLVPLFFVTLGMRADLGALGENGWAVVAIGFGLAAVAVVAKLACGLGVLRRQADRMVVGVGMVPRGEVGLIFAALGLASGLLANWQYTAILLAVFLTTLVTPPWLKSLSRRFTHDASPALAGSENLGRILEP